MRIAPFLYRAARTVNDIEAVVSLNPVRIMRRLKNKIIGRAIAKTNIFRTLYR